MDGSPSTLEKFVVDIIVKSFGVVSLNIRNTIIPCMWMLGFVHYEDTYNHPIEYLCMSISLGMECIGFDQLAIHHGPKYTYKICVPIRDKGL
jgi:hypothetical protein